MRYLWILESYSLKKMFRWTSGQLLKTVPLAEGNVGLPVLADWGALGDGVQLGHHLEEFDSVT